MATVNYLLKSKTNPANLYCRFVNSRSIDIITPLNIFIDPTFWDKKHQKIRNVISVKNRDTINRKLAQLKIDIVDNFNLTYMNGEVIDVIWLKKCISDFFNRPSGEVNNFNKAYKLYYTNFADWWLKEEAPNWLVGHGKYLNAVTIKQYEAFVNIVKDFEKSKTKIKFREVSNKTVTSFVEFLGAGNYASKTIKRLVGRFKFFLLRAEEYNIVIDKSFTRRVFIPKPDDIKEPYLNPKEIDLIYNHDFSKNQRLDNARDNLIIAVWTGLRVSDFLRSLNIDNFIDDYIEITTQKTETPVTIPVHPMVKKILIKRNGKLPSKVTNVRFNLYIKDVCKLVGIKNKMEGSLYDGVKKRKIRGIFEKYKLISSHIGRRSFATNHIGKVSNQVIMKICGWSTENMMLSYIKKSDRSYAVELQKYWETEY